MADTWKRNELRIAKTLGGVRVPVSGRGDQADVDAGWLAVECKQRKTLPAWLKDALSQARKAATDDQLPICVLHEAGRHDSLVVLALSDFKDWFGDKETT